MLATLPGPDWVIALIGLAVLGIVAWTQIDRNRQLKLRETGEFDPDE